MHSICCVNIGNISTLCLIYLFLSCSFWGSRDDPGMSALLYLRKPSWLPINSVRENVLFYISNCIASGFLFSHFALVYSHWPHLCGQIHILVSVGWKCICRMRNFSIPGSCSVVNAWGSIAKSHFIFTYWLKSLHYCCLHALSHFSFGWLNSLVWYL